MRWDHLEIESPATPLRHPFLVESPSCLGRVRLILPRATEKPARKRETNMANEKVQNFENHVRQVPVFAVGQLILMVSVVGRIVNLRNGISFRSVMDVLVGVALITLFVFARNSTVTVQNRLIRLEMQLRLERLLSADLRARIPALTLDQLISLRFASDAELPALTQKVLDEKLTDRKTIKKLVKDWQADWLRA